MTDTVNNAIPLVPENTTDPAAGLNLAIDKIDVLLQLAVLGIETAPPSGSLDGDRYIIGPGATGDWSGQDGKIARYVATGDFWDFHNASVVLNEEDDQLYVFNGSGWWEQSVPVDEFKTNSIVVKGLVKDRDLTSPPGSPAEGEAYIPKATATGAWAGHENEIAAWIGGAWFFVVPVLGQVFWIEDEGFAVRWEGSSWAKYLGSAASRDVGTSSTNLMQVGSFGLGSNSLSQQTLDLNTISGGGWFSVSSSSTNKPTGSSGVVISNASHTSTLDSQFFVENRQGSAAPKIFFRQKDFNTGSWNSWVEFPFLQQDVSFGDVSLSGVLKKGGVQVVGSQQSAIADSSGGDEQTKINAILAALRAHGLIAT